MNFVIKFRIVVVVQGREKLGQDGTGQMGQLVLRYVELVGTEIVYLYIIYILYISNINNTSKSRTNAETECPKCPSPELSRVWEN